MRRVESPLTPLDHTWTSVTISFSTVKDVDIRLRVEDIETVNGEKRYLSERTRHNHNTKKGQLCICKNAERKEFCFRVKKPLPYLSLDTNGVRGRMEVSCGPVVCRRKWVRNPEKAVPTTTHLHTPVRP